MSEPRPCDVCIINNDDHAPKEDVVWCGTCAKWRCAKCRGSIRRIASAVVKHHSSVISHRSKAAAQAIKTVVTKKRRV